MLLEQYADRLPSAECLEWPHGRTSDGYGQVQLDGRAQYVHRVAFIEANGREPVGGEVRHTCDNPPCFNPAHLKEGTHRQNGHDMARRMRQPATKLDWQRVAEIRAAYATGGVSQRALAARYNISQRVICKILNNQAWPLEAAP